MILCALADTSHMPLEEFHAKVEGTKFSDNAGYPIVTILGAPVIS